VPPSSVSSSSRKEDFTSQHDVTYQKTRIFSGTAVRASNLTCQTLFNIAPNIVTVFFIFYFSLSLSVSGRERSSVNLCTGQQPISVMIPEAV